MPEEPEASAGVVEPEVDVDDGLGALNAALRHLVLTDLRAASGPISEQVASQIGLAVEGSHILADVLGVERAEGLAALVRILAIESEKMDPEEVLRKLFRKLKELQEELARMAPGAPVSSEEEALRALLAEKEEEIERLQVELAEALRQLKLVEIASSDVVRIREQLLEQLQATAASITEAVAATREREVDGALAAYLDFRNIQELDRQCLIAFQELNVAILADVDMFKLAIAEYEEVGRAVVSADGVPSLGLYTRVAQCLRRFEDLKILQNQLIRDQVGDQADASESWFEADGRPKNYYEVLGVERDSNAAAIKEAYRKAAMDCHPDHYPDDPEKEERFKEISEAYEVLYDPDRRAIYDRISGF